MTTFKNAIKNQSARTTNGMVARKSTAKATTDLFFKIGASRGKNIIPGFIAAYVENPDVALRIAQWARDIREGSGERQLFRDILTYLSEKDPDAAIALINKVPELGRYDDLLINLKNDVVKAYAYAVIGNALKNGDGLAAKWMPRKGAQARELRQFLGLSPKNYRKLLVNLTKVVETQMCQGDWDNINFSHVPSVASARYKKAFNRHTTAYAEYVKALVSKDPVVAASVKVNAGAVYPYDVLKDLVSYYGIKTFDATEKNHILAQWEALPNYLGNKKALAIVDVSGSMTCLAGGRQSKSLVTCLDVAVSLGLYVADKNYGPFKDTFLTFSGTPQLMHLQGDILQKADQMVRSNWDMNTNFHAALRKILSVAKQGNVPQEEMPETLLVLSDMQFDQCIRNGHDLSAIQMIRKEYEDAGYVMPQVVFWNLNAYDNVPVKYNEMGVALVSGFSPSILKAVLAADMENFTPEAVMLKTVMNPRYDLDMGDQG